MDAEYENARHNPLWVPAPIDLLLIEHRAKERAAVLSSYLEIAEEVLRRRRVPMGTRAILRDAYLLDLMPSHLYGETQHKTLQARLSEDILQFKERSRFVRTEPGKFFLRVFLADETIPAEFRTVITARRRKRELTPDPVLSIARDSLGKLAEGVQHYKLSVFEDLRESRELAYFRVKDTPADRLLLWSFAVFTRGDEVLSYRVGRYRAQSQELHAKRTIGFTSLVTENQQTLFNHETLGIIESGVIALAIDLDFPMDANELQRETSREVSIVPVLDFDVGVALVVFETRCPSWFEPTARRLSMNDMKWMHFRVPPNHLDDFDPWSQAVVKHRFGNNE